jgi:hypothetical protein
MCGICVHTYVCTYLYVRVLRQNVEHQIVNRQNVEHQNVEHQNADVTNLCNLT